MAEDEIIRLSSKERLVITRELLTIFRRFPAIGKEFSKEINISSLFDVVSVFLEHIRPEKNNKVGEWINFAEDDLYAYEMLHGARRYGLALYHLQQSVEKLLKANAIILGIKKESGLLNYGHRSAEFFVELYESEFMKKIITDNPVKSLKIKPLQPESIELLKKLSKARLGRSEYDDIIKKILEMDMDLPKILEILNSKIYLFSKEGTNILVEMGKKALFKQQKLKYEIEKLTRKIDIDEYIKNAMLSIQNSAGVALLLLPLSILTPIFESAGRYPDERRRFITVCNKDFDEMNLVKYSDDIVILLKRYIETFKNFVNHS